MERVDQALASVLHQRPYRDSSLLIEVFSREHGRLGLIANGARRPRSRLRAVLQPMQEVLLSWSLRGDLGSLRQAETASRSAPLPGDALYAGLYMNELLMRLCQRGDPHPVLYDNYRQALLALAGGQNMAAVLRVFERDLLNDIGYGLQLDAEADTGQPITATQWYSFSPQQGARRMVNAPDEAGMQQTGGIAGAALLALQAGKLEDPELRAQVKPLLQQALAGLLDNRPLRTVQTLRQLRAARAKYS